VRLASAAERRAGVFGQTLILAPVSIHLRPTAQIAPDALLPGDPGRALALAQDLLETPQMSNHHRGLWGYSGTTADGRSLTIQSTGIGGPSAAIVLHELAELGVRRAIRIGTCGALDGGPALGSLVVAAEALAADGTSRALDAPELVPGSAALGGALAAAAPDASTGRVATTDLFYGDRRHPGGAVAFEMEAAPLFALGARLGVEVACLLTVVSDSRDARISDEQLREAEIRMGRAAAAALAATAERDQVAADSSSTSSRD
jgi:uridine phosphorylase